MRALLLALIVVVLLPLEAIALPGAAWRGKKVVVRDYTSAEWRPHVAAMVGTFNATLPKRAPRLVYRAAAERPCTRVRDKGAIAVCVATLAHSTGGKTSRAFLRHVMYQAEIQLPRWEAVFAHKNSLCHEFMHATTGIPDDDYEAHHPASCVHGRLATPGAFDIAYARKVYKKYGGHRSGPRDRARGKHR